MEPTVAHGCDGALHSESPTQILSDEHRVIERVLDALEGMTRRPVEGNLARWQQALDFIRHFADQCHHIKEEKVLFPALEEHGIPSDGGPVGMMLIEHEEGRSYVRAMAAAMVLLEAKNSVATESLFSSARAYVRLLREHIQKEDEILFRMADEVIPADKQKTIVAAFAQHEVEEMGAGVHEKYLAIARQLESLV